MYISLVGLKDTARRIVVLVAPSSLLGQSTIIPPLPVREVGYPLLTCISIPFIVLLGGRAVSILIPEVEIEVQTKEYMRYYYNPLHRRFSIRSLCKR